MTKNLWTLVRLIIRRDRLKIPLAIGIFVSSLLAMVPLLKDLYGDEASLTSMFSSLGLNPAMLFLTGPMDGPVFGAMVHIETLLWWGLVLAFINTMLVVRHTRHNEEIGAQELILSGQVHRGTSLIAVMTVALVTNILVAVGLGLGMQMFDAGWGADQAWLFGVAMGMFGMAWAGVAAIVVQLVDNGRSANGMLASLIGVAFVVRGIGDFLGKVDESGLHQPMWASYLSPFGWMQASRPLTESSWWPIFIPIVLVVVSFGVSLFLLGKRDVGFGILPSRGGRARASKFLVSQLGLTWKLQKNIFIGWLVALLLMIGTIAALVPQMGDVLADSASMQQAVGTISGTAPPEAGGLITMPDAEAIIPAFMSAMISITALMVFAYAIHGLGRLRSEETSGHLEILLSTKLSRLKWVGMHVGVITIGGMFMMVLLGGSTAVMTNAMSSDITLDVAEYTMAGLSYMPVMLVMMAIYILLFGVLPRVAGVMTWLYFGVVTFLLWIGPMLKLEQWIMELSVMELLSSPPVEDIKMAPIFGITTVSLVVIAAGMTMWRKRNLIER